MAELREKHDQNCRLYDGGLCDCRKAWEASNPTSKQSLQVHRCEFNPLFNVLARHPRRAGDCEHDALVSVIYDGEPLHVCIACSNLSEFIDSPKQAIEQGPRLKAGTIDDAEVIRRRLMGENCGNIAMEYGCTAGTIKDHECRALAAMPEAKRRSTKTAIRAAWRQTQAPSKHPAVLESEAQQ